MNRKDDSPPAIGDPATATRLLGERIENGRNLLEQESLEPEQLARWNRQTEEVLVRVYGRNSPNVATIVRTAGNTPVWLGMPAEVHRRYRRSTLENQVRKLEGCVTAIQRKSARTAP